MFSQELDSVPLVFHTDKPFKLSQLYTIRGPGYVLNDKGIDMETMNIM